MEWKPIERAPKDGTRILAYAPEIDRVLVAAFQANVGGGSWVRGGVRRYCLLIGCRYPTHPGSLYLARRVRLIKTVAPPAGSANKVQ